MTLPAEPKALTPTGLPLERGRVGEVARLAGPVVLTQISVTLTGLVDSAMLGRLGPSHLAAAGFGGIWLWTFVCAFIGTASATQTFVSQEEGAGHRRRCGAWSWQALYALVPAALAVTALVYFFAEPGLAWTGASEALQPLTAAYVRMRILGSVGLCSAVCFSAFFRGIGDTRTPMWCMLSANVVNAVLDYGLIFGNLGLPRWGIEGAGVATAIAEWVYLGALLAFFLRRRTRERHATRPVAPQRVAIRRLLRTGLPVGGQWALEMTSFAAFSTLVARMGDTPMAASQAFLMLLSLTFMQAHGLSMAVATLVGQAIGARDPDGAERSFRSGLVLAGGLAAVVAALFIAVPERLLGIFSDDEGVLALARPLLLVGALFQAFDSIAIVCDGALRGAGDTRWPFLVRLFMAWGVYLPLAYLLGTTLDLGLTGAWVGGGVYVAVLAAVLAGRFRSGAWRRIAI